MRFAITGGDRCIGIFQALAQAGWEPLRLFTLPPDNRTVFNRAAVGYAQSVGVPVQTSRLDGNDLAELGRSGCEVLVVAGYDWRIPPWRPHLPYAVNFHPSLLPQGRGPAPLTRAILEQCATWGVSCHRLADTFDSGEILAQESFELAPATCLESLTLQTEMAGARLARRVARDFEGLWERAVPQSKGDYWPTPGVPERTIDFNTPVEDILRHVRAFAALECLASIKGELVRVYRAVGWPQAHANRPGAVVHSSGASMVVAAADGYIGLLEWQPVHLDAEAEPLSAAALGDIGRSSDGVRV